MILFLHVIHLSVSKYSHVLTNTPNMAVYVNCTIQ